MSMLSSDKIGLELLKILGCDTKNIRAATIFIKAHSPIRIELELVADDRNISNPFREGVALASLKKKAEEYQLVGMVAGEKGSIIIKEVVGTDIYDAE